MDARSCTTPGRPICPASDPASSRRHSAGARLLRLAKSRGAYVTTARAGNRILGNPGAGYCVRILHPTRTPWKSLGRNDDSLVLSVETASGRAILTGDLEEEGIARLLARLLARPEPLTCDLLMLPHHGAEAANLGRLLDAGSPTVVVASARTGGLSPRTRSAVEERGLPLVLTSAGGRVRAVLGPQGVSVSTFLEPRERSPAPAARFAPDG